MFHTREAFMLCNSDLNRLGYVALGEIFMNPSLKNMYPLIVSYANEAEVLSLREVLKTLMKRRCFVRV